MRSTLNNADCYWYDSYAICQSAVSRLEVSVNIAVFADLHGRILLCFLLCARWEQETQQRIDVILQAGDLGAYPARERLDRATIRHAQADPTELGFLDDFTSRRPAVERALSATTCPLIFVRGNHEDHAWLDALEAQTDAPLFPIDAYQRIYCLKTGVPYTVEAGTASISLVGIGRIGVPIGETNQKKPKYAQQYEVERLYDMGDDTKIDILLTHDAPRDAVYPGAGLEEIRLMLDIYTPAYHFYGHTEQPFEQHLDANGITLSCRMADLNWEDNQQRRRLLTPGVMGMLRWQSRDDHSFEVVNDFWLNEYGAANWRKHL